MNLAIQRFFIFIIIWMPLWKLVMYFDKLDRIKRRKELEYIRLTLARQMLIQIGNWKKDGGN